MSGNLYRALAFFIAVLSLTGDITCQASNPETSASAFVLMDADSGRVLLSRSEAQELSIASTTKIMTALVALEHGTLSDEVAVKRSHLKEGSSMYLAEGETVTMEALLYGLLLPSGNDAAECIAEHCGGTTEQFIAWMNEKAAALGMTHTHFANSSGLDAEGHYSCALDMAKLAACAMRDPTIVRIVSTASAGVGSRSMANHNKLLGKLPGCIGLKTGYTDNAGRTLVTCAERNGLRLVAVTLNDRDDWNDHTALYEYGFSAYRKETAVVCGQSLASIAVLGGDENAVSAVAAQSFSYPVAENEALSYRLSVPSAVSAPLFSGQKLGEVTVCLNGQEIGRVELVCTRAIAAVKKKSFAERFLRILSR